MGKLLGWITSTVAGRWVGGIAIASLLMGGFIWLKIHDGKVREEEAAKQADKQTQEIEKLRAADRAATQEVLNAAHQREMEAEQRAAQSREREAGLVRTIQSIGQRSVAAVAETSRLSDSERRAYIISRLHLRADNDNTPCYTAREEAAITEAITQYPLCVERSKAQDSQIAEVKEQVAAQNAKIDAMDAKFSALEGYTTRLEGYYGTLHDMLSRKQRSAKCLWLWACKSPKPLNVPPLEVVKNQKLKD